jgi:hypothetical protein
MKPVVAAVERCAVERIGARDELCTYYIILYYIISYYIILFMTYCIIIVLHHYMTSLFPPSQVDIAD